MDKWRALATLAVAKTVAIIFYFKLLRPGVLNWGASHQEADAGLPGDGVLPSANLQTTRAITIDAPTAAVWPWLVQMGPRPRAGAYTYDWVERLLGIDIENSDRILPEFQHLGPGDFVGLNAKGQGLKVISVENERSLVLQWQPQKSTWAFVLERNGAASTRLLSRNRLEGHGLRWVLFMRLFMEPGSLLMERKMLFGIKSRAERLYRDQVSSVAATV
ncbi:MAG TPA: SRPBCC family protein [Dehalococcoidia bacterium]|jgi:hypothetical protein